MDWGSFLLPWTVIYLAVWAGTLALPEDVRKRVAWLPVITAGVVLGLQTSVDPGQKLIAGSLFLLLMIKGTVLLLTPSLRRGSWLLPYLTFWPGIEVSSFDRRKEPTEQDVKGFSTGWALMLLGVIAFASLAMFGRGLHAWMLGALSVVALIVAIHFGTSQVLTCCMRLMRFPVSDLFDRPTTSRRLSEFWSRRWNIPFVDMNRLLLMPWATRLLGRRAWIAAFLASGLLHEVAISYPAGKGYGLPFAYFVLQAGLIAFERRARIRSRVWVVLAVLLPAPILFHPPFLESVVAPLVVKVGDGLTLLLGSFSPETYIMALGALTLLPVLASVQVPKQLKWREELGRMSSLNSKLMWVYGGFIVLMILAQGVFLLTFPSEIVAGSPVALAVVGFCALFWSARLVIDLFVFKPTDWPAGAALNVGRTLLNTLFIVLAVSYPAVIVWATASN